CFPGVEIKGGVCYFLWNRDSQGSCEVKTIRGESISSMTRPLLEKDSDVFVRYNEAIEILRKVSIKKEVSFSHQVSVQKPFGLRTFFKGRSKPFKDSIKIYTNDGIGYVKASEINQNNKWINAHKVYI